MTEIINMDRFLILLSSALSEGSEMDGVEFGGAEGICHEIAGCSRGHRSGQEAQSGPGHPLFGPRYEYNTCNHNGIGETSQEQIIFCTQIKRKILNYIYFRIIKASSFSLLA